MPQISTKASNAASASFLVSAIQISWSARLAFGCWLFGSLFKTLAVLCTQQRWPRVFGHTSSTACQKPSAPSATASSGPIESPRRFRSRSSSLQDCALSRTPNKTALAMIFKLAEAAEKSWRRLDGHNQLPKVILGVKFADGVEVIRSQAQAAAA